MEAINHIFEECSGSLKSSGKEIDKNRVKLVVFVFNKSIKEGSLPILNVALDLLNTLLVTTKNSSPNKAQEIKAELQN